MRYVDYTCQQALMIRLGGFGVYFNIVGALRQNIQLREAPIPPPHNRLPPDVRKQLVEQEKCVGQDEMSPFSEDPRRPGAAGG